MTALWERICSCLNGYEGRMCDFLPQYLDENTPSAGVFVRSEGKERRYYDGSVCLRIPFEVRLRVNAYSVRSRLDALVCLMGLARYIRCVSLWEAVEDGQIMGIRAEGGPYRGAVLSDGCEEYGLRFSVDVKLV